MENMKKLMESFMNEKENGFEGFFNQYAKENLLEREDYADLQNQINNLMEQYPKVQYFLENDEILELTKEEKEAVLQVTYLREEIQTLESREAFKLGFKEAMIYFQEMGMLIISDSQYKIKYSEHFEKWKNKYFNKEVVDLKKHFTDEEFKILNKLGVEIKDKIYTEYEFELLDGEVIDYYKSADMDEEELKMGKDLSKTGVSQEDYDKLLDKIRDINVAYNF